MKQKVLIFSFSFFVLAFFACNSSQSEASKQAEVIKDAAKANTPGGISTSDNGAYMKAKIDGKNWAASAIIPDFSPSSSYQRIAGEGGGNAISFQLWKRGIEIGKKFSCSEKAAVDLTLEGFSGFLTGRSGEAVISKFDDQWLEGTFSFIAASSSSDRKIEVTDGRFRIPIVADAK